VPYQEEPDRDSFLFGKGMLNSLVRDGELAMEGFELVDDSEGDEDDGDHDPVLGIGAEELFCPALES
jgi:hypothetical protein